MSLRNSLIGLRNMLKILIVIALIFSIVGFAEAIPGEKFYGYIDNAYSGVLKIKVPSRGDITLVQTDIEEFYESDYFSGRYGFKNILIVYNCQSSIANSLNCAYEGEKLYFYINNQFVGQTVFKNNIETRLDFNYSSNPRISLDVPVIAYIGQNVEISAEIKDGIKPYYISKFECYGNIIYSTQGMYGTSTSAATLSETPKLVCRYDKEGDYFVYIKGFDSYNNEFYVSEPIKIILPELNGGASSCISNWDCDEFSECAINNFKTRTCRDLEQCGDESTIPLEKIFCKYSSECSSNWKCTEWADCYEGKKTRTCTDLNYCNKKKPAVEKECGVSLSPVLEAPDTEIVEREKVSPVTWIMAILIILVGSTAAFQKTKHSLEKHKIKKN